MPGVECAKRNRPELPSAAALGVVPSLGPLNQRIIRAESTPSQGTAGSPFPGYLTLSGNPPQGLGLTPDLLAGTPLCRGPPCRPAAAQVEGNGHDLCQHQLCLLQLQRS